MGFQNKAQTNPTGANKPPPPVPTGSGYDPFSGQIKTAEELAAPNNPLATNPTGVPNNWNPSSGFVNQIGNNKPVNQPQQRAPQYQYTPYSAPLPQHGGTEAVPYLEQYFQQYGSQYQNPSASGQLYGQLAPQLQGPGNAQTYFQQNQGQFGAPGSLEQLYAQAGGQYGQQTPLDALAAQNPFGQAMQSEGLGSLAQQMLGGQGATDSYWNSQGLGQVSQTPELIQQGQRLDQGFSGANQLQQFAGRQGQNFEGPGAFEQFASQALQGTSPYYKLLADEGRANIDQAAIARGAYGSGGALGAIGKYQANLDAQQARDMAALQQSAQSAQMQRLGLGADVAGRSSAERMGQFGALQNLFGQQFDDRMQGTAMGIAGSSATDQANVARLAGITGATTAGDQIGLSRLAGQANLAGDATRSNLDYLNSQFAQAGAAQGAGLNRLMAGMEGAMGADRSGLDRMGLMGELAGQTDIADLNRLNSMFSAAGSAQGAAQDRVNSAFQNDIGKYLSGLLTNVYNNAGQMYGDASGAGIAAGADVYKLFGMGQQAEQQGWMNFYNNAQNATLSGGFGGMSGTGGKRSF